MEKTDLYQAIIELDTQEPETLRQLSKVLREYVDNGTWVLMPVSEVDGNSLLCIHEERGKHFVVMYSDESEVRVNGRSIVMTDIKKLLDPVYESINIDGIIIDPETNGICIEKEFLLKCILHGYLPQQDNGGCPPRDWGFGIPDYSEEDLMTEGELLNFAMHTILGNEKELSDYTPVSACDHTDADVNFIFEKDGKYIFIKAKGYCAEKEPVLSEEERDRILLYSELFNADCYYAPVGFLSATDLMRIKEYIALRGDKFRAKYEGLQRVELNNEPKD